MTYEDVIREALKYADGEDTVDTVLQKFNSSEYQGFHFDGLYLVTSVVSYETEKRVRIAYAAGVMTEENVPQLLAVVEQFAEKIGAKAVEIVGRQGWARKLRHYGYEQIYVVVRKRLTM